MLFLNHRSSFRVFSIVSNIFCQVILSVDAAIVFLSRQPVGDFVPRLVALFFFRRKKRFFYFADRQAFLGCVWKRERMWGTQNAAQASQRPATSSEFMIPKDSAIWAATWEREKMRRFRRERRYKSNYFTHTAQQVSFMPTFDNMSLQKFKSPATPKPGSGLDVRVLRVSQLHAVLSVSATAQGWRSAYFTTQGLPLNVMIAWLLMSHLRWGCTWLALPREKKAWANVPGDGHLICTVKKNATLHKIGTEKEDINLFMRAIHYATLVK